jgi:electron transfer flavoprotein beta subunit
MKAIVCVKQVPDTSGKVSVKPDGTLDRASMATITNPDDLNALEAALKLKDATGCEVVVVTMGPPPAEGMLRELLARGADKAVLVSGREFGGSDTFATSQILAAAVNKIGVGPTMGPPPAEGMLRELLARGADKAVLVSGREFGGSDTFATSQILAAAVNKIGVGPEDVVFCGRQAIDGDTAQVGPQIAEKLHLPQVTYVADIQKDGNTLTVKRMLEDGYMMVKVQTPCLLTCIKELNQPRYMSVNGIFTCYDKPMEVFDYNALKDDPLIEVDTIGLKGSPTNVFKSFTPPQKGAGTMLTGDDVAAQLAGALAKKHLI